jgi:hypothetical protein
MEMIEYIPEEEPEVVEPVQTEVQMTPEESVELSDEEVKQKQMEDLLAKSSCTHENYTLHVQQTKKGPRYFPVCEFCGKRERYVKNSSLTVEEKAEAVEWVER